MDTALTEMQRDDAVKQMSPDDCEHLIAKMVYSGVLQIDFGFTAYATTAYLKCSSRASFLVAGEHESHTLKGCMLRV